MWSKPSGKVPYPQILLSPAAEGRISSAEDPVFGQDKRI
jgi:hypothetical protein